MVEVIDHPTLVVAKLITEANRNNSEAALRVYRTAVEKGVPRASVATWVASWDHPKDSQEVLSSASFVGFNLGRRRSQLRRSRI